MCRLAAYLGEPLFLEELIATPRHSLMRQSLHAEEAKMQTNGDGFGIGWYGERDEPGVYRDATPAWSDDNLLALSQTLRSRLFFAHVRAATAGASSRQNCHPFRHGRHLFMHNGQVGGYGQLRRMLESWLPDALYAQRKGVTDSELIFLLAMARHHDGAPEPEAMLSVLHDISTLMQERGIEQPTATRCGPFAWPVTANRPACTCAAAAAAPSSRQSLCVKNKTAGKPCPMGRWWKSPHRAAALMWRPPRWWLKSIKIAHPNPR
jgi:predicted glutamine amidotransferase